MSKKFLNTEILVEAGTKMLQLVSNKFDEIAQLKYPVVPQVQPGFLRQQFSEQPPLEPESLDSILKETETKIFPGLTLWSHPNFYAYYPSNITHASIIAEIFASAFGTPGFQWLASPAQTELENIVVDWVVYGLDLPNKFLMKNQGGGTIAGTVSDAIFISVHVAKRRKMKQLKINTDSAQICKFVGYYVESAHACATKALHLKDIYYQKKLPVIFNEELQNYVVDLQKAIEIIEQDIKDGLIPFWLSCSFGTTGTCAFDPIDKLGEICQKYQIWFNVDAAYAGSSWLINEYREKAKGLEFADSIEINFAKLMMCGLTGSLFYVNDKSELAEAMGNKIDFEIYKNKFTDNYDVWDYKDWQVALGKRFNSIKMFWMIKSLGLNGMKEQIQQKIEVANHFEQLVRSSNRFRIFTKPQLGLVTFLLVHEDLTTQNKLNRKIQELINQNTMLGFISGSEIKGVFYLRVSISNHTTTKENVEEFWNHISKLSEQL
ncbi:unnamed protein product (macronuclear) [Paramecium tetraurelia]|uniref:Aromatic-L-amino-acid decarboxylase n=1 Tax=Paramecium tetraurelia TaxID=5888 RepID=A0C4J2_PARTE|nr:uncharacterized protein GSPATT00035189001 [Paramecium tetraurelia]CAK65709.1 unnamed protein product [Paramecium tetraurelia]|eukprot:XP_001433106.1 hypothetical protein (macronuclear) [Paramecium tetraurelia strain d4-2]